MNRIKIIFVAILLSKQAFAQIEIKSSAHRFHPQQIHYRSQPNRFQITNTGDNPIQLKPVDIYLSGQNAKRINFSILNYNIWHDQRNWPQRLERMLPEIEDLDPDLVGLQEVIQRSYLENQAKTLADSLGYHYYYNSLEDSEASNWFGNAILSKQPVEETGWTALEHPDGTRNATRMNVVVKGHSIDFYTVHLHHVAVNNEIRETQINQLLDFIEETSTGDYVFISGDFNADPDWEEMELMYQDYQDVYPLFHENHMDPEHSSVNHLLGHIQRRIDYIFYRKDAELFLEPVLAEVVLDTPNQDGVYGSDHYGVFAEFTLLSDTEDFILESIADPFELQGGESTEVHVTFAPVSTGNKAVYLHARDDSVAISGEGYDATVLDYPWQENFLTGSFPPGWESALEIWSLQITNEAGGEAPEMVFESNQDSDGIFTLYAPPFNTQKLDSITLSFKHHLSNPENQEGFTLKLISLVDEEQRLIAEWESPETIPAETFSATLYSSLHGIGAESLRLAWVVDGNQPAFSRWHIDDIQIEALPALHISPADHDFGNVEIHTHTEEKMFNLSNPGGGILPLEPGEISITGIDAGDFILNNLENSIALENEEITTVGVSFRPKSEGEKHANLIIKEDTIKIRGNAFDATIQALPWTENFSDMVGEDIPLGWQRDSENWGVFKASNAGGEVPEMVFWWQPETEGSFYLQTPNFKLDNTDTLVLSFKHRVRNFGSPGNYTLKVVTLANNTEALVTEWVDPATIEAGEVSFILDAENHRTDADSFRLAWVFDGPTDNITQWDIDDLMLYAPQDKVVPEISPEKRHFEDIQVNEKSGIQLFQIKNIGGIPWTLHPDEITIEGADAEMFYLHNLRREVTLGLNESAEVAVSFQPSSIGVKKAKLVIGSMEVALSGNALSGEGYFVYSDFSITEEGTEYTNVGGFREVPESVQNGSLQATDVSGEGEGEYGNTVLKLDYDLALAEDFTVYCMWAYPVIDLSEYNALVVRIKSDATIQNLKIALQDADGVSREDGAGFMYIDVNENWETFIMPVADFQTESWADHLPDLSRFQKIDFVMENNEMTPQSGTLWVDMIGFTDMNVSVPEKTDKQIGKFSVYPNPASDNVIIETKRNAMITLSDITGKIIFKEKSSGKNELNIADLKKGIYLIQSDTKHQSNIKKLIVH
jgi:endonuclease/exonuclease/phosphatase family metal-dependent hydrolase/FlaG/FlaF family flagellin (archaellin)